MKRISEKQCKEEFLIIKGNEINSNINNYNKIFGTHIEEIEKAKYFIFSNNKDIDSSQDYTISGINIKNFPIKNKKYMHEIELINNKLYYQNSEGFCLHGPIKRIKTYKIASKSFSEYKEQKNTFLNFIDELNENYHKSFILECLAIKNNNVLLLENIICYKNKSKEVFENKKCNYYDKNINKIKSWLFLDTDKNNEKIEKISSDLEKIVTMYEFINFLKENQEKINFKNEYIHKKNDNLNIPIPFNLINGICTLNLIEKNKYNICLPFYYQYKNYKNSTLLLTDFFSQNIIETEYKKSSFFSEYLKIIICKEKQPERYLEIKEKANLEINMALYGLYFPILMNFRQSIELSFKLIFVNEYVKKQNCTDNELKKILNDFETEESKIYEKASSNKKTTGLGTHNLLSLLSFIKKYISDTEIYNFLHKVSSFIYYREHTDPSFSRYILDKSLDLNDTREIVYFEDLIKYIDEFYDIMEELLSTYDFGFDINNVFTKTSF